MSRTTFACLFMLAAAIAAPAVAQATSGSLTIDAMVANGRATAAERDSFVRDYVASCMTRKAEAARLKMSDTDLAEYCQCSASRATGVITADDIAFMVANGQQLSPTIRSKLAAIGTVCAQEYRERVAGQ